MEDHILNRIHSPQDLQQLSKQELVDLAEEIRTFLVDSISKTGGHLASNLGVVELTLAIHRVFQSPLDKIVWDVGHQSYVHKILTGRKDRFDTLRKENGLSGFPRHQESVHDAFIGGHSSTSISAGYGIAKALSLKGSGRHVVAVIGDGSYTGGMVYEAMNNAGRSRDNLIVILNHNDMSISKNVGAFAKYLSSMRSKPGYIDFKHGVENVLDHTPLVGKHLKRSIQSSKSLLKNILYNSTWFEEMGFHYLGPVDGHNLNDLITTLTTAKSLGGPVIVHVDTVKGKGYSFAEENPGAYHGISKFDVETGNPDVTPSDSYSNRFGKALVKFAGTDNTICAITAAMKYGTGLQYFASKYPSRFFDVGIAEQHAVTFSAGLASQGMRPVFAVYSSFLQRGYDQIIHDCAIERQHVVFGVDRAGIVGDDGETHQGVFDVAFFSTVPGVTLYSPETYAELEISLQKALYDTEGVAAVRYPRGSQNVSHRLVAKDKSDYLYQKNGTQKLAVTYGRLTENVCKAAAQCSDISVLKLIRILPIPEEAIEQIAAYPELYFFEEGIQNGGIGQQLICRLLERGYRGKVVLKAIDGEFVKQGDVQSVLKRYGLDVESMVRILSDGGNCERETKED
jgi:1-deoxy-D-xylulose-5-phosphate synthase